MNSSISRVITVGAFLFAVPLAGAQVTSDWGFAAGQLRVGQETTVTTVDGSTHKGLLTTIDATGVTIGTAAQAEKYEIAQITEVRRRGDKVWNGALIGAGAGLVWFVIVEASSGGSEGTEAGIGAVALPLFGFGIGAAIDALHVGSTAVYRRSAAARVSMGPLVAPGRYGVFGSMTFR